MQPGGGSPKKEDGYTVGGIELNDKKSRFLWRGSAALPTEFEILKAVYEKRGSGAIPKEIYENVGGDAFVRKEHGCGAYSPPAREDRDKPPEPSI